MGLTCPRDFNPADFFISTLAIEPDREDECRAFVNRTCDDFASSSSGQEVAQAAVANAKSPSSGRVVSPDHVQVSRV